MNFKPYPGSVRLVNFLFIELNGCRVKYVYVFLINANCFYSEPDCSIFSSKTYEV